MKNVIRFPHTDREKIREQACIWLAKLDAGADNVDYEALSSWLNEDSEHLEVLFEMADLWDQMAVLSELAEVFPLTKYPKHANRTPWLKSATAFAASVCLILACIISLNWMRGLDELQSVGQIVQGNPNVYETRVGQQSTVALPDGSQVILNTNTLLEVVFTNRERRVYLRRGEGLFSVAKDKSRPFRVFAGQSVVEAVGTAFSVQRTQEDDVEVMVTEGKVKFRLLNQNVKESTGNAVTESMLMDSKVLPLEAGEFAVAPNEGSDPVRTGVIQPDEMEVKLAWQHGMLLFQGDPLEQVLREFGRYTTVKLEATEAVKNIKVQGYYRAGDVGMLLSGIQKNFPIVVQEINKNYVILTAK